MYWFLYLTSLADVKSDRHTMSYMALHNSTVLHCALERWKDYSVQLDCKHNTVEELQFYTGIQISRSSSRTSSRREHPLVSPPVRAMTGRGGGWGCPKRATRKPNLTVFVFHVGVEIQSFNQSDAFFMLPRKFRVSTADKIAFRRGR